MSLLTDSRLGNFGGYFAKECPEFVRKEYSPEEYTEDMKVDPPVELLSRFAAGVEFEESIIDQLRQLHPAGSGVVILDGVEDRSDRDAMRDWVSQSMDAFRDPDVWFIVNPRLATVPDLNLTGEPDFAVRHGDGWAPLDAKDHQELEGTAKASAYSVSAFGDPRLGSAALQDLPGRPRKDDSLQLAHYHRMFEAHGLAPSDVAPKGAILGRSGSWIWRDLDRPYWKYGASVLSALDLYDSRRNENLLIVQREYDRAEGKKLLPLSIPEKHGACSECPWRQVCREEMEETSDVTLLTGVTPARASTLRAAGVNSIDELADLDHASAVVMRGKVDASQLLADAAVRVAEGGADDPAESLFRRRSPKKAEVLREAGFMTVADVAGFDPVVASMTGPGVSQLPAMLDQARVHRDGGVYRARGIDTLSIPRAEIEVDIDFEDAEGYTYMFGYLVSDRVSGSDPEYHAACSWDQSPEGEARAFAEYWQMLDDYRNGSSSVAFYYYSQHEVHAMRELAVRHEGRPGCPTLAQVNDLVASDNWIDMYPIVKNELVWPTESLSVKAVARHVGHDWSGENAGGMMSILQYTEAVTTDDPEVHAARVDELLVYNKEDNIATLRVREWICGDGSEEPGVGIPPVSDLDPQR